VGARTKSATVIVHLQFAATSDTFSVRVRESDFRVDILNAVRFDGQGRVAAFGEDQPGEGWTQKPIYDPLRFQPALTSGAAYYYTSRALKHMKRGWRRLLDGYEWELTLPGYEELSAEARRDFERNLSALASLQAYTINGRRKLLPLLLFRLYH